MHAITLVIIYNYVLFGFRSNVIFIKLYDLQYSDLFVYLILDPVYIDIYCFISESCFISGTRLAF